MWHPDTLRRPTNTGNASLTFTAVGTSGPFAIASAGTTCSTSTPVAASGSCTVAVTFTPTAGGPASGSLLFSDNAPASPQTVALTGTGQDFTVTVPTGSSTTATVTPGQSTNYLLSLSGLGGMNQTINFTCTGAPSEATCTVNPSSTTPSSGPGSITVTVTTTAPSGVAPKLRHAPPLGPGRSGRIIALLLLELLMVAWWASGFARRPRQAKKLRWGLALAAATVLALAITGCGGGGGGGGGGNSNPGTPPGTYNLTVTGTVSGSANLQHSTTLTLTVS